MTIKEAFQKLSQVTNAGIKNPWFVIRNLGQTFADIADKISGGGSGSTVEVTQVLESGTKIASISVDGNSTDLYAPTPASPVHTYSTTEQIVGKWIDGTSDVYEITINLTTPITIHYNAWTSTTIDSSDMDIIINCRGISESGVPSADVIASTDNDYIECQTARNGSDISDVKYFIITYVKLS